MIKPETVGPRSKKLSELVAAQLMEEIRTRGWPVGESLGTEAELMARFKVSRATIAEAVRQVERYGAAIMRRGAGGGLLITSSAKAALSRTISTYLELSNVSITEQYEATRLIESEAVMLAAQNINEEQAAALRLAAAKVATSEDNLSLHRAAMQLRLDIADASGSRPVLMFMRALARVLTHYVRPDLRTQYRDREFEHGVAGDLSAIVEAIVAGNGALAAHFVRMDIERREHRARELAISHPSLDGGPLRRETPNKLAEKVAYAIRDDIARTGWQAGERLGDEADLPARYGVSQWVLRQAIRILEPSGIVSMRRGQGGGLYIGHPTPNQAIETAVSYLSAYKETAGPSIESYAMIRRSIFQEIAQFAAKRSTLIERQQLLAFVTPESPVPNALDNSDGFWSLLPTMGRNQVLHLFGAILNGFIAENDDASRYSSDKAQCLAIATAINDGDAPLAQRRMGIHMQRI
jgi:DNA-binding FadR family transcriptional regulator